MTETYPVSDEEFEGIDERIYAHFDRVREILKETRECSNEE